MFQSPPTSVKLPEAFPPFTTELQLLEDRNRELIRCHLQEDTQNTFPRRLRAKGEVKTMKR